METKINKKIKLFILISITFLANIINADDKTNQKFLNNDIDSLLIYNQELKSLKLEYRASTFKGKQKGAFPDPIISGGYLISPVETRLGPQIAKISLNQKIPWFSLLNTREKIADIAAEIKNSKFEKRRQELIVEAKEVLLDVYLFRKTKKYKNEIIDLQKLFNEQLLSNLENNIEKTDQISILRSEIIIDKMIEEISDIDIKLNLGLSKLNKLTENHFKKLENIESPDSITNIIVELDNRFSNIKFIQKMIDNSYLFQIQLMKEAISKLSIEEANKEGNPNFGIGVDYIFIGEREDMDIKDSGKDAIVIKAQMSIPFFSNKYNGKVEEKEILLSKEKSVLQDIKNRLKLRIEKVLTKIDISNRKIELQKSILIRLYDIKNLTDISYSTGISKFKESMNILKELYSSKILIEKNRVEKLKQYLQLDKIQN